MILETKCSVTAIHDLQKLLSSQRLCLTGQDAHWHHQVLAFLHAQVSDIQDSDCQDGPPKGQRRVELSMQVARHSMKGKYVAERIRAHESLWVKQRAIPKSGRGKNARISCVIEDPGTRPAMEQ